MRFEQFMDGFYDGMSAMLPIVIYITLGFVLTQFLYRLGFSELIQALGTLIPNQALLFSVFVITALFSMFSGILWPVAALLLPICIPLANTVGVSPYLLAAAVFSGTAFGAVTSMRGSVNFVLSRALGTDIVSLVKCGRPYTLIAGGAAAAAYLLLGFFI